MVMQKVVGKEKTFAFFAAGWTDAMAKGNDKDNGRAVKNDNIFKNNLKLSDINIWKTKTKNKAIIQWHR